MHTILLREFTRDTGLISWRACWWPASRIFPLLGILLNLIALSACISTSRVSPERQPGSGPSHPIQTHVSFNVAPYGSGQSSHHPTRPCADDTDSHDGEPGLKNGLEQTFASATYVLTPGPKGTHVNIEVLRKPPPDSKPCRSLGSLLALVTFTAVPWHYDGLGYVVLYNLYVDGKIQRTYRYEIIQKGIMWLPLALFIWANYFTTGETEAFKETVRQFAVDAERDRYFQALSAR